MTSTTLTICKLVSIVTATFVSRFPSLQVKAVSMAIHVSQGANFSLGGDLRHVSGCVMPATARHVKDSTALHFPSDQKYLVLPF